MRYRVLLVDDEPIILSGIKFLIDWDGQDCDIVGTARNGQQALEAIQNLSPDIVLCDIRMPVKSGLELLEECNQKGLSSVFIMLTNYQDFDLARQTMRLQAVDYLVKTQLEPETLIASLNRAKAECEKRGRIAKADELRRQTQLDRAELARAAGEILNAPDDLDLRKLLSQAGMLKNFCFIQILMDASALPALSSFSHKERRQLMDWEKELVEKLAGNLFSSYLVARPDYELQRLNILCWDLSAAPDFQLLFSKLKSASENTTQMQLCLLCGSVFSAENDLPEACVEIAQLYQYHYLMGGSLLTAGCLLGEMPALSPLDIQPFANRLSLELRAKNRSGALSILEKATEEVSNSPHFWKDGIDFATELYNICSLSLGAVGFKPDGFFSDGSAVLSALKCCTTRQHLVNWLELLARHTAAQLDAANFSRSSPAERARQYVLEHTDEKITLQNAADAAGLSPSYFSALFKKEFNKNFMDFVNETKMQRACQLIREGNHRIYEISYMLGFENAYYFTRVFRKHIGMTPTEYQHMLWENGRH